VRLRTQDLARRFMKRFLDGVLRLNEVMQAIASVALTFIVLLTTMDVILRLFRMPIPGSVEIIAIAGGILLGFTVPITSWMRGHISVDFVLNWLPERAKDAVNVVTRCIAIFLVLLIGWNCAKIGSGFRKGAEVSGTLEIPLYPVAYALAVCFLVLALVLVCDIIKIRGGTYE
jgi:TRAP-type C4-dicarboxylate transport system permease small subunit